MTESQKRQYVANLYHSQGWRKRVAKMPDDQITAIYLKHLNDGTKPSHSINEDIAHLAVPPQDPHQNEDEFPIY